MATRRKTPASDSEEEGGGNPVPIKVEARGVTVEILDGGISFVAEVDGKAMPVSVADYKVKLAAPASTAWKPSPPLMPPGSPVSETPPKACCSPSSGLEFPDLFDVPAVKRAGGLAALQAHGHPAQLVMETKRRLFVA